MSIRTDNLDPKFANEDPTTFYDLIVDINSFRHLKKEENNDGDWGWNVLIKKDFDYEEAQKKDLVSIGVVGNGNRGKSFLLSKISGFDFPTGYSVKTKGISVKYPEKKDENDKNIVVFDSAGFETPIVETSDFQLGQISDARKAEEIINEIARDRAIIEYFTQEFIIKYSNVIVAVVGQLTFSEQQLLVKIKNKQNKRIFVVHNLYNFETVGQVKDYIDNTLLKSLTFKITPQKYVNFPNENLKNKNEYYYHEEFEKQSIEHLILGKEGSESGDYYNQTTLDFLRNNVTANTKVKKAPIIENVRKHLISMSSSIFENKIPKENIKYEDHKFFVDEFKEPIILKKIETDSLGISSFYGKAFTPNYNFYVVNSYNEIQTDLEKIKKFSSKEVNSISDLEGKTIYVLQVELSGNEQDRKKVKPDFEIFPDGKIHLFLRGERKIYDETALEESKKSDSYQNLIKQGDFALLLELSHEIISIERIYLGSFYEDGIYTFFYYGGEANDQEDIDFESETK